MLVLGENSLYKPGGNMRMYNPLQGCNSCHGRHKQGNCLYGGNDR